MNAAPSAIRWSLDLVLGLLVAIVVATVLYGAIGPRLGHQPLVIRGGSMAPAIALGSVVDVARVDPSDLRPGDIVSVRAPNDVIGTHRVTRVVSRPEGIYLETKGDANLTPDPVLVPASAVMGRVDFALPLLGYLMFMLSTVAGALSILFLGITLLLSIWLLEELERAEEGDGVPPALVPWAGEAAD
jgi:signal peptidase